MEFKQLEAFVAVVDYGSFSEAARKLYLTQPTISAHVRSLEEELHTKLILRTTKKTTITTRGYQLYDSAVRMLEIRNNLLENFTGVQKHMIDLSASTIPSSYLLPEILAAFGKTHPDISLWSDKILAMRPVSFFHSVRINWSLPHRSPIIISAYRTKLCLSKILSKIRSLSVKKAPALRKKWIFFSNGSVLLPVTSMSLPA